MSYYHPISALDQFLPPMLQFNPGFGSRLEFPRGDTSIHPSSNLGRRDALSLNRLTLLIDGLVSVCPSDEHTITRFLLNVMGEVARTVDLSSYELSDQV